METNKHLKPYETTLYYLTCHNCGQETESMADIEEAVCQAEYEGFDIEVKNNEVIKCLCFGCASQETEEEVPY